MNKIGGNITAQIQTSTTIKNEIGEAVKDWNTVQSLTGFLDMASGDSKYTTFYAKIKESTHVFICDYVALQATITEENSRLLINGKSYDVMLFDNPMELNQHWEIYLKYTGGQ